MKMKSIGAVAAGIGANFWAVPADAVLHATGVFPAPGEEMDDGLLAIALRTASPLPCLGDGWLLDWRHYRR